MPRTPKKIIENTRIKKTTLTRPMPAPSADVMTRIGDTDACHTRKVQSCQQRRGDTYPASRAWRQDCDARRMTITLRDSTRSLAARTIMKNMKLPKWYTLSSHAEITMMRSR